MLALQKNSKTIKTYTTAYELADDIENVIAGRDISFYNKAKAVLRQNAFAMAIKGAKITFGGGYRFINDGVEKPLGDVKIAKV